VRILTLVLLCGALTADGMTAQTTVLRLYPDTYEIALARSAAPPELSREADVYVLRAADFEKVRAGTNGAVCLVARDHPESLYPICYTPEAARAILPIEMVYTESSLSSIWDFKLKRSARRLRSSCLNWTRFGTPAASGFPAISKRRVSIQSVAPRI